MSLVSTNRLTSTKFLLNIYRPRRKLAFSSPLQTSSCWLIDIDWHWLIMIVIYFTSTYIYIYINRAHLHYYITSQNKKKKKTCVLKYGLHYWAQESNSLENFAARRVCSPTTLSFRERLFKLLRSGFLEQLLSLCLCRSVGWLFVYEFVLRSYSAYICVPLC